MDAKVDISPIYSRRLLAMIGLKGAKTIADDAGISQKTLLAVARGDRRSVMRSTFDKLVPYLM